MLVQMQLSGLKRAYKKAVAEEKKVFRYKGCEFLVGYAKYLIEYLQSEYQSFNLCEDEHITINSNQFHR